MALVCYSHLPCRICSQIVRMYKSVAIQYNHHGLVCQLLRQYRVCVAYTKEAWGGIICIKLLIINRVLFEKVCRSQDKVDDVMMMSYYW